MKLLLLIALLVPMTSWSQCTQRVDNNNVVIFIDTNTGDPEIAEAQRGACQSGRRLVVIPRNYRDHGRYLVPWLRAHRASEAACSSNHSSPACQSAQERAHKLESDYRDFKISSDFNLQNEINRELAELQRTGAKASSIILSGHDGGGSFGGQKGGISRRGLAAMMREYPGVDNVESMILAGCFTGVQEEIGQWRSGFPNLRAIYGYDGYAPLSDRPAGHQYISSALRNDRRLRAAPNAAAVNRMVGQMLPALSNLNAGTFLQLDCNEEVYYASGEGRRFASISTSSSQCQAARAQLTSIARQVNAYFEGQVEPPSSPAELRQSYQEARRNQHCIAELGLNMDVDQMFNLRFYGAVKSNFATFFAQDIALAEQMLADLPPEVKSRIWIPNRANLESKSRAELLRNQHEIFNVLFRGRITAEQRRALEWVKTAVGTHLHYLKNPFEWHEVTSAPPVAPQDATRLTR